MKITAAVIEEKDARFDIVEVELDEPRSDEMVVRIAAAGMCHSDLSVRSAATPFPLPAVVGHEGAGVVESVGSHVNGFVPGDRVVLSFDSCGQCSACQSGRPVYCERWVPLNLLGGSRLDGSATLTRPSGDVHGHFFGQSSFASHALVRASAAVRAPDGVDLDVLAPIGCSVQTGVGAVLNVASPEPGSTLVVFGAGGVGLSAVLGAVLTPVSSIVVVDVNASRLELASQLGATHAIDATTTDPIEAIRDLTGGVGADYAIETSGQLGVLDGAIASLAAAGTCVVIGAPPLGSKLPVDVTNLLGRGIRLRGTNQGDSNPTQFLPRLIDLHLKGRLPFDRFIRRFAFEQINDAAAEAVAGTAIKPVLLMSL
jgi:aryl-alcohol dehydrogenase